MYEARYYYLTLRKFPCMSHDNPCDALSQHHCNSPSQTYTVCSIRCSAIYSSYNEIVIVVPLEMAIHFTPYRNTATVAHHASNKPTKEESRALSVHSSYISTVSLSIRTGWLLRIHYKYESLRKVLLPFSFSRIRGSAPQGQSHLYGLASRTAGGTA